MLFHPARSMHDELPPFVPLAIIKSPFDLRVDTTSDQHAHICVGFVANKSYSIKKNRALVDFNQGTG
jgi:hypothetical protein